MNEAKEEFGTEQRESIGDGLATEENAVSEGELETDELNEVHSVQKIVTQTVHESYIGKRKITKTYECEIR